MMKFVGNAYAMQQRETYNVVMREQVLVLIVVSGGDRL